MPWQRPGTPASHLSHQGPWRCSADLFRKRPESIKQHLPPPPRALPCTPSPLPTPSSQSSRLPRNSLLTSTARAWVALGIPPRVRLPCTPRLSPRSTLSYLSHPCSSALLCWPAVWVKVEVCAWLCALHDLEEAHVRVPHRHIAISSNDVNVKQTLGHLAANSSSSSSSSRRWWLGLMLQASEQRDGRLIGRSATQGYVGEFIWGGGLGMAGGGRRRGRGRGGLVEQTI
jgi:hypothetical protein